MVCFVKGCSQSPVRHSWVLGYILIELIGLYMYPPCWNSPDSPLNCLTIWSRSYVVTFCGILSTICLIMRPHWLENIVLTFSLATLWLATTLHSYISVLQYQEYSQLSKVLGNSASSSLWSGQPYKLWKL